MKIGIKTLKTAVIYDVMNKIKPVAGLIGTIQGAGHLPSTFCTRRWAFDSLSATAPMNVPSITKTGEFQGC